MPKADENHTTDDAATGIHGPETAAPIQPFLFETDALIRVIMQNGDPWFVALDVCRILHIKNPADAVEPLDQDEKGIASNDTLGGRQGVLIVSEGGLYTLMLRSRGATTPGTVAHRFRRWITGDVIPAIRKTGKYETKPVVASDADTQISDDAKLRKVNTACRCFGERSGAQLWLKLGLDWVPAMTQAASQMDIFDLTLLPQTERPQ